MKTEEIIERLDSLKLKSQKVELNDLDELRKSASKLESRLDQLLKKDAKVRIQALEVRKEGGDLLRDVKSFESDYKTTIKRVEAMGDKFGVDILGATPAGRSIKDAGGKIDKQLAYSKELSGRKYD